MLTRTIALCLFPLLALADDLDTMRLRWRQMLIGGNALDPTLLAVRSRLS